MTTQQKTNTASNYIQAIQHKGADAFFCGVLAAMRGDSPMATMGVLQAANLRDFSDGYTCHLLDIAERGAECASRGVHAASLLEAEKLTFE